jgi:hypothetical protein
MRSIALASFLCSATAALAQSPVFDFKADEFHVKFNASTKSRNVDRVVRAPSCKDGPPTLCTYRFTPFLSATVSADDRSTNADNVTLIFARPKYNVKGEYLYSYLIYRDVVSALSKDAGKDGRGAAVKRLLDAIHTAVKEEARVGGVHYTMDMKRAGVRFVARPISEN